MPPPVTRVAKPNWRAQSTLALYEKKAAENRGDELTVLHATDVMNAALEQGYAELHPRKRRR